MRNLMPLLAGLLALGLVGCATRHHSVGLRVVNGDHAAILILGAEPVVQITNAGPGAVDLVFETPGGNQDESLRLGNGAVERKLSGPVRLRLHGKGEGSAEIRVVVERSAGLRIDGPLGIPDPAGETLSNAKAARHGSLFGSATLAREPEFPWRTDDHVTQRLRTALDEGPANTPRVFFCNEPAAAQSRRWQRSVRA